MIGTGIHYNKTFKRIECIQIYFYILYTHIHTHEMKISVQVLFNKYMPQLNIQKLSM